MKDLKNPVVVPIPKKTDVSKCDNIVCRKDPDYYRNVQEKSESILPESQSEFKKRDI